MCIASSWVPILSMWSNEDTVVLRNARITARLTGQAALVVQVVPGYRVVATGQPNKEPEEVIPVRGSVFDSSLQWHTEHPGFHRDRAGEIPTHRTWRKRRSCSP